jgi:hypothetical protein
VYLINPQAIVIGRSGVVATGGRFVASTLDVGNGDFMRNWPVVYFSGEPKGVVNLGKISSSGGDVLLIAAKKVVNAGEISADNGSVAMLDINVPPPDGVELAALSRGQDKGSDALIIAHTSAGETAVRPRGPIGVVTSMLSSSCRALVASSTGVLPLFMV